MELTLILSKISIVCMDLSTKGGVNLNLSLAGSLAFCGLLVVVGAYIKSEPLKILGVAFGLTIVLIDIVHFIYQAYNARK